jgi:hypothetical protein
MPQLSSPDATGGTKLGDLLEEIVVNIPEERNPWREFVHVQASSNRLFDVMKSVGQCEGEFLDVRRARLADVIPRNRNHVPFRRVFRSPFKRVDHQFDARFGRENKFFLRNEFFQNIVLCRPTKILEFEALFLRVRQVHRPDCAGGRVDRHAGRDLLKVHALEQNFHVGQARDGDAAFTDFTDGEWMIAVVTHQGWQIESG